MSHNHNSVVEDTTVTCPQCGEVVSFQAPVDVYLVIRNDGHNFLQKNQIGAVEHYCKEMAHV